VQWFWSSLVPFLCAVALLCCPGCDRGATARTTQQPRRVTFLPDEIPVPLPPPTRDELQVHALRQLGAKYGPLGEVLTMGGLTFPRGGAAFVPREQQELDALLALLREYPQTNLLVLGYADSGSDRRNARLSLERANAVRDALVKRGVSAARIRARGLGAAYQVGANAAARDPAQSRRVDLVFSDLEGRFLSATDRSPAGGSRDRLMTDR